MRTANQAEDSGAATSASLQAEARAERRKRFVWARQWEFWLTVTLAAILRLWRIDLTQFLDDQAGIAGIARTGLLRGALPLTSNLSSIGTFHSPLTEYLLMPFLAFGSNPLPAVISIALWNIAGVALCYVFAQRYFGRRTALAAALLFASCGTAINYSRFIWQPNYLPPILGLWALVLFAGVARGARGWFVPAVALSVLAMLFHETAAILLVVLAAALLLAPHRPRRREWVAAGVLALLLFLPLIVFEAISRGFDLRALAHYLKEHGHFDLQVLRALSGALGGMGSGDFGTQSPLYAFRGVAPILDGVALLFFACGYVLLTVRVVAPVRSLAPDAATADATTRRHRLALWLGSAWRGLRGDAGWRANLLLWTWVTVPLAATLRHSSAVTVHYLLPIYPALFVVAGLPFQWLAERRAPLGRLPAQWGRVAPVAGLALLALLVAGQSARWLLYPGSLASGQFSAYTFYGYPLSELQTADAALIALQARQQANTVYVLTPSDPRYRAPMDYLLAGETSSRVSIAETCLLLPAPSAAPALVVATNPAALPAQFLMTLPNVQRVAEVPLAGGPAFAVYRVSGATPTLRDELPIVPATFAGPAGSGLRLDAAAVAAPGMLRLRWTVLGSEMARADQPWYRVTASQAATSGKADCQPTRWQSGETLFTWVPLPSAGGAGPAQAAPGPLTIHVFAGTRGPDMPTIGPVRFITGRTGGSPLVALPLTLPSGGTASPDSGYVLPITG